MKTILAILFLAYGVFAGQNTYVGKFYGDGSALSNIVSGITNFQQGVVLGANAGTEFTLTNSVFGFTTTLGSVAGVLGNGELLVGGVGLAANAVSAGTLTGNAIVAASGGTGFFGNGAGITNIAFQTNWPVSAITNAGTAAYSNSTAFALAQSGTIVTQNNSFSLVLSNVLKLDAAHPISLSNATPSRLAFVGADNTVGSAAASGSVPVNADGSATTLAQIGSLGQGPVMTNNNVNSFTLYSNIQLIVSVSSNALFSTWQASGNTKAAQIVFTNNLGVTRGGYLFTSGANGEAGIATYGNDNLSFYVSSTRGGYFDGTKWNWDKYHAALIASGTITATNGVVLPNTSTAPALAQGGAQLWSDGTNLCVIIKNAGGVLTTNKVTMSAWP